MWENKHRSDHVPPHSHNNHVSEAFEKTIKTCTGTPSIFRAKEQWPRQRGMCLMCSSEMLLSEHLNFHVQMHWFEARPTVETIKQTFHDQTNFTIFRIFGEASHKAAHRCREASKYATIGASNRGEAGHASPPPTPVTE